MMILTVIAIGGTILGATTVAGLLTVYQIRESFDISNSAKAIFAADTGIEWGLYLFLWGNTAPAPVLSNGATFTVTCEDETGVRVDCVNVSTTLIRAVGETGNVSRAFELDFSD